MDMDNVASDFGDYLAYVDYGGVSSDGNGVGYFMTVFETASDVEKGNEMTNTYVFKNDNGSGEVDWVWKYGKKPNKMLNFIIWAVLILTVVGGAAYFLM